MKKLLSLLLCFCMVFGSFVFNAHAASGETIDVPNAIEYGAICTGRAIANIFSSPKKVTGINIKKNSSGYLDEITLSPANTGATYKVYYSATKVHGETPVSSLLVRQPVVYDTNYYMIVVTSDGLVSAPEPFQGVSDAKPYSIKLDNYAYSLLSTGAQITGFTGPKGTLSTGNKSYTFTDEYLHTALVYFKDSTTNGKTTDDMIAENLQDGYQVLDLRKYKATCDKKYMEFTGWSIYKYDTSTRSDLAASVGYIAQQQKVSANGTISLHPIFKKAATSGVWNGLKWTVVEYGYGTFTLVLESASGKSSIPNFTQPASAPYYQTEVPWAPFADSITRISTGTNVDAIGNYAFCKLPQLNEVTINASPVSIGSAAFWGCDKLKTVKLNDVSNIGTSAFSGCSSLETIYYLNTFAQKISVDKINKNAFKNCTALTQLEFADAPQAIDAEAFIGCDNLTLFANTETGSSFSASVLADQPWGAKEFKIQYVFSFKIDDEMLAADSSHDNCSNAEYCSNQSQTLEPQKEANMKTFIDGVQISSGKTIEHMLGSSTNGCTNFAEHTYSVTTTVDAGTEYYGSNKTSMQITVNNGAKIESGNISGSHLMTVQEYDALSSSDRRNKAGSPVQIEVTPNSSEGIILEGEIPGAAFLAYRSGSYCHKYVINGKSYYQTCTHHKALTTSDGKAILYKSSATVVEGAVVDSSFWYESGSSGACIHYCTGRCDKFKCIVAYEAIGITKYKDNTESMTFYTCDGHCQGHQVQNFEVKAFSGDNIKINTPTPPGYSVQGWKLEGSDTVIPADQMPTVMPAENRTYKLVFSGSFNEPGTPGSGGNIGGPVIAEPTEATLKVTVLSLTQFTTLGEFQKIYTSNTTLTADDLLALVREHGYDTSATTPQAISNVIFPLNIQLGDTYYPDVYVIGKLSGSGSDSGSATSEPTTVPTEPNTGSSGSGTGNTETPSGSEQEPEQPGTQGSGSVATLTIRYYYNHKQVFTKTIESESTITVSRDIWAPPAIERGYNTDGASTNRVDPIAPGKSNVLCVYLPLNPSEYAREIIHLERLDGTTVTYKADVTNQSSLTVTEKSITDSIRYQLNCENKFIFTEDVTFPVLMEFGNVYNFYVKEIPTGPAIYHMKFQVEGREIFTETITSDKHIDVNRKTWAPYAKAHGYDPASIFWWSGSVSKVWPGDEATSTIELAVTGKEAGASQQTHVNIIFYEPDTYKQLGYKGITITKGESEQEQVTVTREDVLQYGINAGLDMSHVVFTGAPLPFTTQIGYDYSVSVLVYGPETAITPATVKIGIWQNNEKIDEATAIYDMNTRVTESDVLNIVSSKGYSVEGATIPEQTIPMLAEMNNIYEIAVALDATPASVMLVSSNIGSGNEEPEVHKETTVKIRVYNYEASELYTTIEIETDPGTKISAAEIMQAVKDQGYSTDNAVACGTKLNKKMPKGEVFFGVFLAK